MTSTGIGAEPFPLPQHRWIVTKHEIKESSGTSIKPEWRMSRLQAHEGYLSLIWWPCATWARRVPLKRIAQSSSSSNVGRPLRRTIVVKKRTISL